MCSSPIDPSVTEDCNSTTMDGMETHDENLFSHHAFKRRRFQPNETIAEPSGVLLSPGTRSFATNASSRFATSSLMTSAKGPSSKRSRSDTDEGGQTLCNIPHVPDQATLDLKRKVDQQAGEIDHIKSEKLLLEATMQEVKSALEKSSNENRILKRAVTIQQERQNQATSELEAACRYRVSAEERINRLEQMIVTLRYHLQASNAGPANDFMGFNPRPPDVC